MSERPEIYLEQVPPKEEKFLAFHRSHDITAAVQIFVKKYGVEPEMEIRWKGNLYLGPIPK